MDRIEKQVTVGPEEMLGIDLEQFLDLLTDRSGYDLLEDMSYIAIGTDFGNIVFQVSGIPVSCD